MHSLTSSDRTGEFFPRTGKLDDNGHGLGKHYCLNVPLKDGITDRMYKDLFKTVVQDTFDAFRPSAIVLQCGADSLGCDRLGAFNISIKGHGACVEFVKKLNVPLLVLGGGGYTINNVSRCWTYETAILVGESLPDQLPHTVYDSFFEDSQWKLHPPLTGKVENENTPASLDRIAASIHNKLRYLQGAPSVAMQEIPPDLQGLLGDEERTIEELDEEYGNARAGERRDDRTLARNEFFDGEDDVDAESSHQISEQSHRSKGRPRTAASRQTFYNDADADDSTETEPVPRKRGRPKGRGRGRPRKVARKGRKEKEVDLSDLIAVDSDQIPADQ